MTQTSDQGSCFNPAAWDQFCQDLQRSGGDKPDFLYGSASISKPTFIVGLPPSQTLGAFEACKNNFQL